MTMKLLLHVCCAPCSIMCIESLRKENIEPTLFWYNPNIHPFTEYKSRKNALTEYAKEMQLEVIIDDDYGLRSFVSAVTPKFNMRCEYCYTERLNKIANYAMNNEYDAFSTTLLISPYQNHDRIKQISEKISDDTKIKFLYRDFRPYFREGQNIARSLNIYMQKYCGCIFSEEDRYVKNKNR